MKRIIIAVTAIVLSIATAFAGFFWVKHTCDKLEAKLIKIAESAQNGKKEKVKEEVENLDELWEKVHGVIESFVNHNEIDRLEETIKTLPTYAKQGDMERVMQQTDLAINELRHIVRDETPLISNIL